MSHLWGVANGSSASTRTATNTVRPNHSLKLPRYGMRCLAAPGTKYSILPRPGNTCLRGQLSSNVRPRKRSECAPPSFVSKTRCPAAPLPCRFACLGLPSGGFTRRSLPHAWQWIAHATSCPAKGVQRFAPDTLPVQQRLSKSNTGIESARYLLCAASRAHRLLPTNVACAVQALRLISSDAQRFWLTALSCEA
jgi:hypothetical protein